MVYTKKLNRMNMQQLLLIITATATGLIAGLFYAYSCSVNGGLAKLSDEAYLTAMQSINREILNPLFFATFIGTLFLLLLSTWLEYKSGISTPFFILLGASLCYLIGGFGVTIAVNVPLNEALDKFNIHSASVLDLATQRKSFEIPWNRFHEIRTMAAIASFILVIIVCTGWFQKS